MVRKVSSVVVVIKNQQTTIVTLNIQIPFHSRKQPLPLLTNCIVHSRGKKKEKKKEKKKRQQQQQHPHHQKRKR
ncbi:hypothetical protein RUM43_006357 [Polyplax serrata]|uniref:Uncharacterized protein n=1 Tax=Polyplax serrata TaxID=468196 RepID=A0AAN8P188_POLSC